MEIVHLTDKEICLCMSKHTFYKQKKKNGTLTVVEFMKKL